MKLSTKARHAITAMMDLALNDKVRPVTLAEISQSQGISLSYLEQLFAKLRKKGLVVGVRGPGGGYKLSRTPAEINIAQIISAIDEYRVPGAQESTESAAQNKYVTHRLWDELSKRIYGFLDGITLEEFSRRPVEQEPQTPTGENNHDGIFSDRSAA